MNIYLTTRLLYCSLRLKKTKPRNPQWCLISNCRCPCKLLFFLFFPKSFGEQTQVDSRVWAAASDSVLSGSPSHMATCQQAVGGNIIPGRKAAAISACTPPQQSAQGGGRRRRRSSRRRRRGRTCTKSALLNLTALVSLCLSSMHSQQQQQQQRPVQDCPTMSAAASLL